MKYCRINVYQDYRLSLAAGLVRNIPFEKKKTIFHILYHAQSVVDLLFGCCTLWKDCFDKKNNLSVWVAWRMSVSVSVFVLSSSLSAFRSWKWFQVPFCRVKWSILFLRSGSLLVQGITRERRRRVWRRGRVWKERKITNGKSTMCHSAGVRR